MSPFANRNVALAFVFNTLNSLATSILTGTFLPPYIYSLPGQGDVEVGYVAAVSGAAMLAAAVPVGYFTDKAGRAIVLKWSLLAGAIASAVFLAAVVLDSMTVLYVASAAFGVFSAMATAPVSTILADSVPPHERTRMLVWNYTAQLGASAAGPAIATLFFWRLGNEWSTPVLRVVMIAGVALTAASSVLLWFFDDSLAHESSESTPLLDVDAEKVGAVDAEDELAEPLTGSLNEPPPKRRTFLGKLCGPRSIPYVIFASDIVIAIGAGMTVQFFSLFFANDYNLSPLLVSAIYVATPICIALFSALALPMGNFMGRAVTAVIWDAIGTIALFWLSFNVPVGLGVPLYIVRTAAMNASYPTQRAIMMDAVPKHERGKWNAVESLTTFTWTGSAALGGVLIAHRDYRFTFRITGFLYIAGTLILALLIPMTAGEKHNRGVAGDATGTAISTLATSTSASPQSATGRREDLLELGGGG